MCVANGLPFAWAVLLMILFKRCGLNNSTVTYNISLLCLPWLLRPFCHLLLKKSGWSNDVWLLATELTSIVSLLLISEAIASDLWFTFSMVLLMLLSLSSMLHSIATESLYREITADNSPVMLRPRFIFFHVLSAIFGIGFAVMMAGNIEVLTRNIHYAWTFVFRLVAAVYTLMWLYNLVKIWNRSSASANDPDIHNISDWREMGHAFRLFFGYRSVSIGSLFFIFYLMPLGLTLSVGALFIIDSTHRGGLGLSPQEYALACGTVGVIGIATGSLACMRLLRRYHLSRTIVPLSLSVCVSALAGVVLSHTHPVILSAVNICMFIAHVAIGMAFTSFIGILSYYSCGKYRPTFFSIGISLAALSLLLSGLYSGSLQRYYGYNTYFVFALMFSAVSPFIAFVLKRYCFRHNKYPISTSSPHPIT